MRQGAWIRPPHWSKWQPPGDHHATGSVTIISSQTATLSVVATGPTPRLYQWYQGPAGVTTTLMGSNSADFTTPTLNGRI